MAKLAIIGHATRGKEVIGTLKMLGGKNDNHCCGKFINRIYFINENGYIESCDRTQHLDYLQLTLEEFEEKFPHKVGDEVSSKYLKNYKIEKIGWKDTDNRVTYKLQGGGWYSADELQPYKEETTKENLEQITLDIPDGYEFFGINDDNKVVLAKKQPIYPKTYVKCYNVLDHKLCDDYVSGYKGELLENFQRLLICRDAYWKIAGDWKPDWCNENKLKYCIECSFGTIDKTRSIVNGCFLAFPTKEMRDAFYENFKDLIEECKELL